MLFLFFKQHLSLNKKAKRSYYRISFMQERLVNVCRVWHIPEQSQFRVIPHTSYILTKLANGHTHGWRTWNDKSDYIKPFLFCATHESASGSEEPLVFVIDWLTVLSSASPSLEQTSFATGWSGACSPSIWDTVTGRLQVKASPCLQ